VVAHPDDDLFFQSPTLVNEIGSGSCITTLVLTAGDAGVGTTYAQAREQGSDAAYARMGGVSNSYINSYGTFGGQKVLIRTASNAGRIQRIFMRLPDGNVAGGGYQVTNYETLRKLYTGQITKITTIDNSATYTLATLRQAIADIVAARRPSTIRTLNYQVDYDTGDHSDHLTVARLAAEGRAVTGYMGYPAVDLPANLDTSSAEYDGKAQAYYAYAAYDSHVCASAPSCSGTDESQWLKREYLVGGIPAPSSGGGNGGNATGVSGPGVSVPGKQNLAVLATATASGQVSGQEASKAIDGSISGYPTDFTKEWSSNGQQAGAWINLAWSEPQSISTIVIYDRPNLDDWLQSGTIALDGGVSIPFSGVSNDGAGYTINLGRDYITSNLRLTAKTVGTATKNVGLAELQVYGSVASSPSFSTSVASSSSSSTVLSSPSSSIAPSQSTTLPAGINIARSGKADASSWAGSQSPDKAIDDVIDGYKSDNSGDYNAEWSSKGQGAGAWWSLTWPSDVSINAVVLYDRPNLDDQITSGSISFSDGSSVALQSLMNDGAPNVITFPTKLVRSLRLDIASVSSTTKNIGLSECRVYSMASTSPLSTSPSSTSPSSTSRPSTSSSSTAASPSAGINLALIAIASASSHVSNQEASKAIDGSRAGYPSDFTKEWATAGQSVGAWIQLTWNSAVMVNRIVLFDRPNLDDAITSGTLLFSDGSRVAVSTLANDGSPTAFDFAEKSITWLRLTVDGVSSSTKNIGLSEIQAFRV